MSAVNRSLTPYDLSKIAFISLRAARMVMESGGHARIIAQTGRLLTLAQGAEFIGLRIGYASLAISLGNGNDMTTRMIDVGRHGVNHRLNQAVRRLVVRAQKEGLAPDRIDAELENIAKNTPKHSHGIVALAVGLACASFGRLLGVDWVAFLPILFASAIGQHLRHILMGRRVNPCVVATVVAMTCGLISGMTARFAGSQTIGLDMMASILLLVPGVPATNAQTDIMDGHPTTGSARAVSVLMIMIFAAAGIWLAGVFLGVHE